MRLLTAVVLAILLSAEAYGDAAAPIPYTWNDITQAKRVDELLAGYVGLAEKEPSRFDLWERVAMLSFAGWRLENTDNRRRIQFARIMGRAARRMLALDENRPEGHHWQGAAIGTLGLARGAMNSLQWAEPVRSAFEKSIALDPTYLDASALCQLGRMYTMIPGVIGSKVLAKEFIEKALHLAPTSTLPHLYWADWLWSEGRNVEALAELARLSQLKPKTEVQYFLYVVNLKKAEEMKRMISEGRERDLLYDVLSDMPPSWID